MTSRRVPFQLAITPARRARGLLGVRHFEGADAGCEPCILIAPCWSVHTFGMRVAIDLAFLDLAGVVVSSERAVPPGRMRWHPKARAALERVSEPSEPWPKPQDRLSFELEWKVCT